MSNTSNPINSLDDLWAEIYFKENSIPSIHAGKLTESTKTQIKALMLETYEKSLERALSKGTPTIRDAFTEIVETL